MKKLVLIIFFIFSFNSLAVTVEQKNILDLQFIQDQHNKRIINDQKYFALLAKCSDKGNTYCALMLGQIYFHKKEYQLAYPHLIRSQGIYELNNQKFATSEEALAIMFDEGLGVLQDENKAIEHYKKCAYVGRNNCAYSIGWIYYQKAIYYASSRKHYKEAYPFLIRSYAWNKIAQALGTQRVVNMKTGKSEKMFVFLNKVKGFLMEGDPSYLMKAENLSKQICSTIPSCKQ